LKRRRTSFFKRYTFGIAIFVMILFFCAAYYISWPYVIYGPGTAEPVHPRVETGKNFKPEGEFLFTTVSTYSRPNVFSLGYAWLNPRMDIRTEEEATGGTTNLEAYRNLLSWMRDSSEQTALVAAYAAMDRKLDVEQQGVIVIRFLPESKADESGLQEGDIITSADGIPTLKAEDLIKVLTSRKPGDKVKLAGTRGGKPFEVTVPLISMPGTSQTGVGFQHDSVIKVTPPDPVKFDFSDVGGPSAGLMMALEIISQLTEEDLTRGYRIAGTGTIDANGNVGLIGGIEYKLMAADKEKADYFFVPYSKYGIENWPKDQPAGSPDALRTVVSGMDNWITAEKTVRELKLKPKLVPVTSLKEAMDFLRSLPPKDHTAA
jgi:PDZ domain-containing protein